MTHRKRITRLITRKEEWRKERRGEEGKITTSISWARTESNGEKGDGRYTKRHAEDSTEKGGGKLDNPSISVTYQMNHRINKVFDRIRWRHLGLLLHVLGRVLGSGPERRSVI